MKNEPKIRIGKTYKSKKSVSSQNEIIGNYWRVWCDGEKYFYEFDEGHFASKFKVMEISKEDFLQIKFGHITNKELADKYSG